MMMLGGNSSPPALVQQGKSMRPLGGEKENWRRGGGPVKKGDELKHLQSNRRGKKDKTIPSPGRGTKQSNTGGERKRRRRKYIRGGKKALLTTRGGGGDLSCEGAGVFRHPVGGGRRRRDACRVDLTPD